MTPEQRAAAVGLEDVGDVSIQAEIRAAIVQQIREAVLAEREACAAAIQVYRNGPKGYCSDGCLEQARDDIRARPAP